MHRNHRTPLVQRSAELRVNLGYTCCRVQKKARIFSNKLRLLVTQVNRTSGRAVLAACKPGGERTLPTYRLYRLDGAGSIVSADWIEADSDELALEQAQERAGERRFELWQQNRLVGSSPPRPR